MESYVSNAAPTRDRGGGGGSRGSYELFFEN